MPTQATATVLGWGWQDAATAVQWVKALPGNPAVSTKRRRVHRSASQISLRRKNHGVIGLS